MQKGVVMSDIEKIDANFKIESQTGKTDIKYYDVNSEPFRVYGVFFEAGKFRRMPDSVAKEVSSSVYELNTNTAGGRVRFKTDSSYIAIKAEMPAVGKMPHFALSGSAGFDLYVGNDDPIYIQTFMPPYDMVDGYESVIELGISEMREITVNFPLYSPVSRLYIGLSEHATVCESAPYKIEKPIVFYGSSITQGGCASRPGNSYESILSRRFNADYINLGFSGSAMAEESIASYIGGLEMSLFVYDYDHNAPDLAHLEKTHERMFKAIRKEKPELPIIMMSRPKYYLDCEEKKRLEIIERTYNNAKADGDRNVFFITGKKLMDLAGNEGTVDNCHPNDLGFFSMAKALEEVLEKIFSTYSTAL